MFSRIVLAKVSEYFTEACSSWYVDQSLSVIGDQVMI